MQKQLSKRIGNMKGGFQDIKDHPFCEGLDWEHPHRLRVDVEARPFDRENHDWLPGEVVLAGGTPRIEAGEASAACRMRRMEREFGPWRRLHSFLAALQPPPIAS